MWAKRDIMGLNREQLDSIFGRNVESAEFTHKYDAPGNHMKSVYGKQDSAYRKHVNSELSNYVNEQRNVDMTGKKVAVLIGAAASMLAVPVFADGMPSDYQTGIPNDGYVDIVVMDFDNGTSDPDQGLTKLIPRLIAKDLTGDARIRIVSPWKLKGKLSKYGLTLDDFYRNPFCLEERGERVIDGFVDGVFYYHSNGPSREVVIESAYTTMNPGIQEETQTGIGTTTEAARQVVDDLRVDLANDAYD